VIRRTALISYFPFHPSLDFSAMTVNRLHSLALSPLSRSDRMICLLSIHPFRDHLSFLSTTQLFIFLDLDFFHQIMVPFCVDSRTPFYFCLACQDCDPVSVTCLSVLFVGIASPCALRGPLSPLPFSPLSKI